MAKNPHIAFRHHVRYAVTRDSDEGRAVGTVFVGSAPIPSPTGSVWGLRIDVLGAKAPAPVNNPPGAGAWLSSLHGAPTPFPASRAKPPPPPYGFGESGRPRIWLARVPLSPKGSPQRHPGEPMPGRSFLSATAYHCSLIFGLRRFCYRTSRFGGSSGLAFQVLRLVSLWRNGSGQALAS